MWAVFNGSSARSCQLQQVGDWFDNTPWAAVPVSYLVALPGLFLLIVFIAVCLKDRLDRKKPVT
jgi:hypothetical protein